MRALRFYGAGDVRIDQVEEPQPDDDQVQIKPEYCGICGSGTSHEFVECQTGLS